MLSNFLGNGVGGLSFPPRWGLVTPEEIERVDVMYGPFSAAYPGNSVGAVVDYVTRMPAALELHARLASFTEDFHVYETDDSYGGWQASASYGDARGESAWWLNLNHLESDSHPIAFATRFFSAGVRLSTGLASSAAAWADRASRSTSAGASARP